MSAGVTFGLYLAGDDDFLRASEGSLVVEREGGEQKEKIPLESVDSLVVGSKARLSSACASLLRRQGVSVSFINWRGTLEGRLEPDPSKNALIRRAQVKSADDPSRCMGIARAIVQGKIHNQRTYLMRAQRKRGLDLQAAVDGLLTAQKEAPRAQTREVLMGHEGTAARLYFDMWPKLLEGTGFVWEGRNRRPPKDPVNSMLSLGYAVASARCVEAAAAAGLDPYVGFLHAERYGRPELGLDLVEEFRAPWVDSLVLGMIGRQQVTPDYFVKEEDGACVMTAEGRRLFFKAFAKLMAKEVKHPASGRVHAFSMFPVIQARLLGKYCYGELPDYKAFLWR
jgi:CRISPR-associated protein Cas1